jgi:hypothetical protein
MSPIDRTLLWRVHGEGEAVSEVAASIGISRTRATRRIPTLLASARELMAA